MNDWRKFPLCQRVVRWVQIQTNPYQTQQAWKDRAVAEGRPFPAKATVIKMMLWWEAVLADAVAAGDGTMYLPQCYFPCKAEAAPCRRCRSPFFTCWPCNWAGEWWPAQLGNGLCRLMRGDINASRSREGWEGLGNSPTICFLLLCSGTWEGKLMPSEASYLTPAHALCYGTCVTSVSAFLYPCHPGNVDFFFSPAPGPQCDCKLSFYSHLL